MGRRYSEADILALVDQLTLMRLDALKQARIVSPVVTPEGPVYREADLARLQLLCDLGDCYDLQDDALEMVMSLIDQLNTMRGDMRALLGAVASEPDEVRARLGRNLRRMRRN